jgi:hypothetical protein
MTSLITHLAPLLVGFFTKLLAIKSQGATDSLQLSIRANAVAAANLGSAREIAKEEGEGAKWFRRSIVFIVLAFVLIIIIVPPLFDIPLIIQMESKNTFSFLGLIEFGAGNDYFEEINGLLKFEEVFDWALMILEFYFGGQMAKGR